MRQGASRGLRKELRAGPRTVCFSCLWGGIKTGPEKTGGRLRYTLPYGLSTAYVSLFDLTQLFSGSCKAALHQLW
jgi:hypothetical protein